MHSVEFDTALAIVRALAADFRAQESYYTSARYQEQEARRDFIDKLFIALGWDVLHELQRNPYAQEVKIENRVTTGTSQRRADYAFFVQPNFRDPRFFAEAKKPARDTANPTDFFQTVRYGWNAGTPLAVLTDFEQFHVLDCRAKPAPTTVMQRSVLDIRYEEYEDEVTFSRLWYLFGREAVAGGAIEEFVRTMTAPSKGRGPRRPAEGQGIDAAFLEDLDGMRLDLARAFKKQNQDWDGALLTEAVQRTLASRHSEESAPPGAISSRNAASSRSGVTAPCS